MIGNLQRFADVVYYTAKEDFPMKRLTLFFISLALFLTGCSSAPKPALEEMLGTLTESTYVSPFGFTIDGAQMRIFSRDDLAAVNQVEEFTPEALSAQTDKGNAVTVFAAAPTSGASISLSLFPAANLPGDIRTAADYAAYGLPLITEKLNSAGYTDVQVQQVEVTLGDEAHPAVLCSAQIAEGVPYHLLQICFGKDGWMGSLSLASMESEDALGELLTCITTN